MTNDKELIERLALEAAQKHIDGEILSLADIAKYAIAAYLAERGKEAAAWHTDDHLTDKSATTYDSDVAERWKAKGWPVTPHFLAPPPAIPEGMVLVPTSEKASIDVLEKFIGGGLYCGKFPYQELIDKARLKYAKFIAATGEKP